MVSVGVQTGFGIRLFEFLKLMGIDGKIKRNAQMVYSNALRAVGQNAVAICRSVAVGMADHLWCSALRELRIVGRVAAQAGG